MAIPGWQRAARTKAAAMGRGGGGQFAKKAAAGVKEVAGGVTGKEGILKMLAGGKGLGATFKAHPLGVGIGGYFLLQMLFDRIMKHIGGVSQIGGEERLIESQMSASPEDVYYQAMLPQLSEERQGAQNALLQALLGGQGGVPQVPGERIIGG